MKKVFPEKDWVELPPEHEIFHSYFSFNNGLPKVHEHDNKRPQALDLFENEKMRFFSKCFKIFSRNANDLK